MPRPPDQPPAQPPRSPHDDEQLPRPACPVCGGRLSEARGNLQCLECHAVVETCCDGARRPGAPGESQPGESQPR